MTVSIEKLERRARYLMCGIAFLAAVFAITVKAGLVSPGPGYQPYSWYAKETHTGFEIITEYPDEAQCRSKVSATSTCLSGKVLLEQHGPDERKSGRPS